jgi:hypothetical protein
VWPFRTCGAEANDEGRPVLAVDRQLSVQLRDQVAHELQPERPGVGQVQTRRQPHAVVRDRQLMPAVAGALESHADAALAAVREGVLDGVRDQLIDDQPAADRTVEVERDVGDVQLQLDAFPVDAVGAVEVGSHSETGE